MHDPIAIIHNALMDIQRLPVVGGSGLGTAASGDKTEVALFTGRPVHMPDFKDGSFKTELVIYDSPQGTIKINYWSAGDPRETPHNHPWCDDEGLSFRSYVLSGGYTERVVRTDGSSQERTYRAGDTNYVMYEDYHTVYDVLPDTVTLMVCGPRIRATVPWGYLIFHPNGMWEKVGKDDPRVGDMTFMERFLKINPHRR